MMSGRRAARSNGSGAVSGGSRLVTIAVSSEYNALRTADQTMVSAVLHCLLVDDGCAFTPAAQLAASGHRDDNQRPKIAETGNEEYDLEAESHCQDQSRPPNR